MAESTEAWSPTTGCPMASPGMQPARIGRPPRSGLLRSILSALPSPGLEPFAPNRDVPRFVGPVATAVAARSAGSWRHPTCADSVAGRSPFQGRPRMARPAAVAIVISRRCKRGGA